MAADADEVAFRDIILVLGEQLGSGAEIWGEVQTVMHGYWRTDSDFVGCLRGMTRWDSLGYYVGQANSVGAVNEKQHATDKKSARISAHQ